MDAPTGPMTPDPSTVDAADILALCGVDPDDGLSADEATRRLIRDGPNELPSDPPVAWWRKVLHEFADPLVWLLLVAIVISLAAWVAEGASGVPVDALVIAAIVVANAVIGYVQGARAETAMAALAQLNAARATVLRDSQLTTVPASGLVVGDLLALTAGDSVAADARLVSSTALLVHEASLTGESVAAEKHPATLPHLSALGDRTNMVFSGTDVVQGVGRAVVTATGMRTEVGAIADLMEKAERKSTPLQREVAAVSRALGLAILGIAVVVMAVLAVMQGVHSLADAVDVALMGLSLAVAAVPEGLPAVLSLVLAIGVRVLAQQRAVVKDLHAVEALGSVSVICSDKTGTLTRNQMTLRVVETASGEIEFTGIGYEPSGEVVTPTGSPEGLSREVELLLVGGSLANNAQLSQVGGEWQIEGDPTEAAFLVAHEKLGDASARVSLFRRTAEVPFTSERRLMSVLVEHPDLPLRLFTKGAPDTLLARCHAIRVGDAVVALDAERRARAQAAIVRLSEGGYRTLGVAYRDVGDAGTRPPSDGIDESWEQGLVHVGVVGILDPPREGVPEAVRSAHRAGIRTLMITGDHPVTARRIAADLGIVETDATVASGADLDAMDEEEFRQAVRTTSVFARVAPSHKVRILDALQRDGQLVAMTGDGVNDAPALKSADVGVAMGRSGTEVAKRAAVVVLADDNFATLVSAIRQGRLVFDNIGKFLRYLLSSNLGEVVALLFGVVLSAPLGLTRASAGDALIVPLLATQILWINLVTDSAPALALGVDPEVDDVMARPPRRPRDHILGRPVWWRIGVSGLVMGASALVALDLLLPGGLFEGSGTAQLARTGAFTTLVLAQLFNALSVRSLQGSAARALFRNRWLWGAISLGVVLQVLVVHVPVLQRAFGTSALSLTQWLACVSLASLVLVVDEVIKAVLRRLGRA